MRNIAITDIFRRACSHLGIAFSANHVSPQLADLGGESQAVELVDELNAVGKYFGLRFRELNGRLRELFNTVNDSGPVLIELNSGDDSFALVLKIKSRGKVLIHRDGEDQTVSARWLRKNAKLGKDRQYHWLLIKPMFAAGNASRFHYLGGDTKAQLSPLRRFSQLLKPDSQDIRTIVVFSIVIGLLSLTTPLAVEAVVNTIAFGRYIQPLIVLCLIVLVFQAFRSGLNILMTIVTEILQRKLFVRTVEDLSYRLTRVPLSTWKKYHGPELVNRFFDIVNVQKITSKLLLETLRLVLQTVIGLSVLAFYHPFLLGYDIGLLVMMTLVLWFIGRGAIKTAKEESQVKYETAAWLQEIVRHPSTFKFNGGLEFAINRADELAAEYVNTRQRHFRIVIKQISFSMIMQVVAATVLLGLGGYLVIEGQMTLGQLVAAELIVTVILGSFTKLGKDLESYYDLMASVDKLGKLFDLPVEPADKLQLIKQPGPYSLRINNFSLNSNEPVQTIELTPGRSYAVSGSTEIRRSKLIDAMLGQIRPDRGYVLLNDYRVDAISSESLQSKIGIAREIELFQGTVDDNLRMGRENVGSEQVNDMIHRLGIWESVASMEKGLKSTVSISGYPLSKGEAIRLILARALISKPGVLFIDGLLDFLSDEDTADVLERLSTFLVDTTLIVSTGRRAIAEWADEVFDIGQDSWKVN